MKQNTDDYALIIGINDYPYYKSLQGPVNDAREFHKWVIDPKGGAVPESQVRMILSGNDEKPPLPDNKEVDVYIDDLITVHRNSPRKRRLYIFFAGHGLGLERDDTGLCMSMWKTILLRYSLSSRSYINTISDFAFFEEIWCFLDCCRVHIPGLREGVLSPHRLTAPRGASKELVAYATEFISAAYEAEVLDREDAELLSQKQGHFTRALMEALRGAAADEQGIITPEKLKNYLERRTPELAKLSKHKQNATVGYNLPGTSRIETEYKNVHQEIRFHFSSSRKGPFFLEEAKTLTKYYDGLESGKEHILKLNPGLYRLCDKATNENNHFHVVPGKEAVYVNW